MTDCCFIEGKNRFRYRAGAIIIEDNCILYVGNSKDDYLYSVGGGVHLGETAEEAVVREVFEETGIHYEVDHLAFVYENFFVADCGSQKDMNCHEIAFFYIMKPKGSKELNSNSYVNGTKETMHWIPLNELDKHKVYPNFIKDFLATEHKGIEHIITDNRNYYL